jgi:hypothetical protein
VAPNIPFFLKQQMQLQQPQHKATDWTVEDEIDMYYVSTLLEVTKEGNTRFQPYMFALSEPRAGGDAKVQAHYALDSPGNALLTWAVSIKGYDRNKLVQPKARQLLRQMVFALTAGDEWHAGMIGENNVAVRDVKASADMGSSVVSFSIGCAGDGRSLLTALQDTGSLAEMAATLNKGGMKIQVGDLSVAEAPTLYASSTASVAAESSQRAGLSARAAYRGGDKDVGSADLGNQNTHWLTILFSMGLGALAATIATQYQAQMQERENEARMSGMGMGSMSASSADTTGTYQQVNANNAAASAGDAPITHDQL